MEPQARQAAVASASRGLCQAPVTDGPQTVDLPDYWIIIIVYTDAFKFRRRICRVVSMSF